MKRFVMIITALCVIALPAMAQDDGAALFAAKCAACHGKTGAGDTAIAKAKKIPSLASTEVQGQTDAQLTDMIASGGPDKVKGHDYKAKGLTDAQIQSLVAFVRTLKK